MRRGRPSKFDTIDLDEVRRCAVAGWSDKAMHEHFGITRSTWFKWKKDFPEFRGALKGEDAALAEDPQSSAADVREDADHSDLSDYEKVRAGQQRLSKMIEELQGKLASLKTKTELVADEGNP